MYVNGIATCSGAYIKKQVCMSAPQYSTFPLPKLAQRKKFKDYIASCKQTLDQGHGFNIQQMI